LNAANLYGLISQLLKLFSFGNLSLMGEGGAAAFGGRPYWKGLPHAVLLGLIERAEPIDSVEPDY